MDGVSHLVKVVQGVKFIDGIHEEWKWPNESFAKFDNNSQRGGYMPASDHSVASNVDPLIYDKLITLLKTKGKYPLNL
ncbi:MAG: hypothetical protein PWP04_1496 [Candidatus Atribacteria bacterium]|nr:hypothetical protein [Candidatus Atribacteria bacterium]